MAILDNAIWLTGAGSTAADGTTVINDGGNTTTVTGTFTPNSWDASQSGYAVSEFGAFGISSPISAQYEFSNPITNLSFDLQHVSSSGTTYDDMFTLYFYDENGVLLPSADVIAGISGMTHTSVYANPDGSITVESEGTAADTISISLAGPISDMIVVFDNGPDGGLSGGAGIGDFAFSVPAIVCFARDTQIATASGRKKIQDLKVGDFIKTKDNGYKELLWVGSKTVTGRGDFAPIKIAAGALGNKKDLLVSPQHRILSSGAQAQLLFGASEVLVAAKHLVNGTTIQIDPQDSVEYFHIMFDQHELVFANGVACESFQPNQRGLTALDKKARDEIFAIFPELKEERAHHTLSVRKTLKKQEVSLLQPA